MRVQLHTHLPGAHVYRFGVFELDSNSGELRRHGLKVRLPDQSFQILKLLLSRAGDVVSRDELKNAVWSTDTFVDFEVGLNSAVRKLREALDDAADNPRFVATVPRHGYRFIGLVAPPPVEPPAAAGEPSIPVSLPQVVSARGARMLDARGAALLVLGLIAVIAMAGFVYSRKAVPGEPIRSIVVLPFENLTGDKRQDNFVDSITDAVTAKLRGAGLDVISSRSARQDNQADKRIPEIGKALKVDGVVEATVAKSGERVTVTVKLIRAATDRMVWTQVYSGDLTGMFSLQQQIAFDLADAAERPGARPKTQASASSKPPGRSGIPAADDAYLNGVRARGLDRYEGFARAVGYFEDAIRIQPDFAEAHAELAITQMQFLFGGPYAPHEIVRKAEAAANRALELDETLPRAHRVLGRMLHMYHWRWEEGDRVLAREAKYGNADESGSISLTSSLLRHGQFDEAIATATRWRRLDPLALQPQLSLSFVYTAAGRFDRALEQLYAALESSPGNGRVHHQLGVTLVAMGRVADAIPHLEIAGRLPTGHSTRIEAFLGYAYAAAGRTQDARNVLQELERHRKDQYVSWFGVGLIHDALGEKAPALNAVQRAFEDRAVEFALFKQYPPFRTIASDPSFVSMMQKVGLPR